MSESQSSESLMPDENAGNRGVIEALLIASDEPLGAAKLASVLNGVDARQVRAYVDELNEEYGNTGRSFKITEVAGGYQLMVHPEYAAWIRRLLREKSPARLSPASLETLAIIAFKQPLIKAEVEHIRGVAVDGVLRHLLEKGLIRIAGRAEGPGRPLLYGTTRDFLKHFGLKTLSDLPKLRELEEMLKEEDDKASGGGMQGDFFRSRDRNEEGSDEEGAGENGEVEDPGDLMEETEVPEEAGLEPEETGGGVEENDDRTGTSEPVSRTGGGGLAEGERPADSGGAG